MVPSPSCAPPHACSRAQHGAHDPVVRPAPAEMRLKRAPDIVLGGILISREQRRRTDQHTGEAIAALARLLRQHGSLQRMRIVLRAEPFDGGYVAASHTVERTGTGELGHPVDQDHAAAALLCAATETSAKQTEPIADDLQQRHIAGLVERHRPAVQYEFSHRRAISSARGAHFFSKPPSTLAQSATSSL